MSSHQFTPESTTRIEWSFTLQEVAFACCFGLALGAFMGYQIHEQTTPAVELETIVNRNSNKIAQIEAWLEKYRDKPIAIHPIKRIK